MFEIDSHYLQPADNLEYVDYLKSIEDQWPEYTLFREFLEANSKGALSYQRPGFTGDVLLCDVFSDNSRQSSAIFRAGEIANIHNLEYALSNPPEGLRSRIIILGLSSSGETIDQRVLNLFRLKFNIEPLFYVTLSENFWFSSHRLKSFLYMSYMNFKELRNCAGVFDTGSVGRIPRRVSSQEY